MEPNNKEDKYAVAVKKGGKIVGRLPKGNSGKLAKTVFFILKASSTNSCMVTIRDKPMNCGKDKGMQVPCTLILLGNEAMTNRLKDVLPQ